MAELFPGTMLNPDADLVQTIRDGVEHCHGNCPCIPKYLHTPDTLCPCLPYRTDGTCKCKLFVEASVC